MHHLNEDDKIRKSEIRVNNFNRKLLIVDDDEATRILIHKILKGIKITVIDADSGKDALRLFKQYYREIGLVFLDIKLPDCDGWELIKPLRRDNPQVPIVALTAINPSNLEQKCKKEGLDGFLSKPVSIKRLRGVIDSYLNN